MVGRKRSFDTNEVLDQIMRVFWRSGYVGTSMSDLVKATGLTKPSLYLAYGQKEDMYRLAMARYLKVQSEGIGKALFLPNQSVLEAIFAFLDASVRSATTGDGPKGCFVLTASSESASASVPESIQTLIKETNTSGREMLRVFFSDRSSALNIDEQTVNDLSDYVLVLQSGLMQMALRGLDRNALIKAVDLIMSNFPLKEQ